MMAGYRLDVTVVDIYPGALCPLINSGDDFHVDQTYVIQVLDWERYKFHGLSPLAGQLSPTQVVNTRACSTGLAAENGLRQQRLDYASLH